MSFKTQLANTNTKNKTGRYQQ